ncbi:MAG: hypothetical protein KDA77_17315 [Planctomycetaceae bacterium]|nr:hypothetical protein [Planctomycetaceae bacterium]
MTAEDPAEQERRSLEQTKEMVCNQFLGTHGIHGIGVQPSKNAVRLYVNKGNGDIEKVLDEIEAMCAPYSLDVVREEAPKMLTSQPEDSEKENLPDRHREA